MTSERRKATLAIALLVVLGVNAAGQSTFQNLDFENGVFVPAPTPSNPFAVEWLPAMPGWTGYLGTNQQSLISLNALSLSLANIAIMGPDNPAGVFHGHYYIVLQGGDNPLGGSGRVGATLTQSGTIPGSAQSIRFEFAFGGITVFFAGQPIPLTPLSSSPTGYTVYGGDISTFAGQAGELRFQGGGYLDFIQFSDQPIPEPGTLGLFAFGALVLGWRLRRPTGFIRRVN